MVVLTYLGAMVKEFICNKWERKGMITGVSAPVSAICDQRQMSFILL